MIKLIISAGHAITLSFMLVLLAACSSNPPHEEDNETSKSLDEILFHRAETAFYEKNYKTTLTLTEPLAAKGNARAQYTLGYLYYHGNGVEQDINQAIQWFTKASKQGNSNARQALKQIQSMTGKNKKTVEQTTEPVIDLRQPVKQTPADTVSPQYPSATRSELPMQTQIPARQQLPNQSTPGKTSTSTNRQHPVETFTPPTELESNTWINNQPANNFTIQLASSTKKTSTLYFISQLELDGVHYFNNNKDGVNRYTVIHGSFSSFGQAKRKLKRLQERGYEHAWIRMFKNIQLQKITQ